MLECPNCNEESIYLNSEELVLKIYETDKNGDLENYSESYVHEDYLQTIREYGMCQECLSIFKYDKVNETILLEDELDDFSKICL